MDSYSFANAMRPFQWKHCECMDVSTKTLKKNSECIWTNANTEIPSRFCVTLKCVTFEKLLFITQFTFQIIFVRKTQFYYVYFSLCMMIMTGKNVEKTSRNVTVSSPFLFVSRTIAKLPLEGKCVSFLFVTDQINYELPFNYSRNYHKFGIQYKYKNGVITNSIIKPFGVERWKCSITDETVVW